MTQTIIINDKIQLTEFRETDIPQLIDYLNNREHHEWTLMIPHPYTQAHAEWWLNHCRENAEQYGHICNFAIRNREGSLLGGIGRLMARSFCGEHKDEIGYWIAKPFWRQGVASTAIQGFADYWFQNSELIRFEAYVFPENIGSQKALLKAGFESEGYRKKYFLKPADGCTKDVIAFAKVK
jgi:RimJ/RimL family protein N-acetyltransferase